MRRICILFATLSITFGIYAQNINIQDPLHYLALGDSYTIGESVTIFERWPVQLGEAIKTSYDYDSVKVDIIARTGWTTTELLSGIMSQYDESIDYNLVSLLIGVNNQYRGYDLDEYEPDLNRLMEFALEVVDGDASKVFVLSIPDYSYTPSHANRTGVSEDIDAYNQVKQRVTSEYGVTYIDVTQISRRGLEDPDLVAFDGLHPSGKQYKEWVDEVMLLISKTLNLETASDEVGEKMDWSQDGTNLSLRLPATGGLLGLYDTLGRLLKQERQYSDVAVLPVENYNPGVYLVRYRFDGTIASERVYID